MTQKQIEAAAMSGTPDRGGAVLTYAHAWPDGTDGRVWYGMARIVRAHAQTLADAGLTVEIYDHEGHCINEIYPGESY